MCWAAVWYYQVKSFQEQNPFLSEGGFKKHNLAKNCGTGGGTFF